MEQLQEAESHQWLKQSFFWLTILGVCIALVGVGVYAYAEMPSMHFFEPGVAETYELAKKLALPLLYGGVIITGVSALFFTILEFSNKKRIQN